MKRNSSQNGAGCGFLLAQTLLVIWLLWPLDSLAIPVPVWITNSPMHTLREYHTATLLPNGEVLVAGGLVAGTQTATNGAELYDPSSGACRASWSTCACWTGWKTRTCPRAG